MVIFSPNNPAVRKTGTRRPPHNQHVGEKTDMALIQASG